MNDTLFGEKSNTYFLSDLPQDFMKAFWDEEGYRTTPVAIWAMKNAGTQSLRYGRERLDSGQLPPEEAETQKLLTDLGVTSGIVVGFSNRESAYSAALALLNFGRDHDATEAVWAEQGMRLELYAKIFNLKVSTLPVLLPNQRLTSRQSEVLTWVGRGKTANEIATILNLSPATIEKHLRQAREALGVSTTTQAVLHAQINAQIFSFRE